MHIRGIECDGFKQAFVVLRVVPGAINILLSPQLVVLLPAKMVADVTLQTTVAAPLVGLDQDVNQACHDSYYV